MFFTEVEAKEIEMKMDALACRTSENLNAWRKVSDIIEKATAGDEIGSGIDLDGLFAEWLQLKTVRDMSIERIRFSKGQNGSELMGKNGYQLMVEDLDGEIGCACRTPVQEYEGQPYVHVDFLDKLLELAAIGNRLIEGRSWERKDV